jgi:hypothetical protein
MNAMWIQSRRLTLVGLLGTAVLFGSPVSAQADQGKWWNPERGTRDDRGARDQRGARDDRSVRRSTEGSDAYRAPAWRDRGAYQQGPRYSRPWQGRRIYRERTWLRSGRGYRGRPASGWRYYSAPSYYYPRHIIYVRPVRFFISARIGGVHVRAGNYGDYGDPCDIYGCNFCDAQFTSFDAYEHHMAHCPYAPRGYRVVASDWDHGQWNDGQWQDDRGWDREDEE